MKNVKVIFCFVASLIFALPMKAEALVFVYNDNNGAYENDSAFSVEQYGIIEAGYFTFLEEDDDFKIWYVSFDVESNNGYVYLSLSSLFGTLDTISILDGSDYVINNMVSTATGKAIILFESLSGSGGRIEFMVSTTDAVNGEYLLNILPLNLNCSVSIPGYYFDDNGNSITQEEYNRVCNKTSTGETIQDIPNSSDIGSVVPYIAIGGGLVAIIAVYLLIRKLSKINKI